LENVKKQDLRGTEVRKKKGRLKIISIHITYSSGKEGQKRKIDFFLFYSLLKKSHINK